MAPNLTLRALNRATLARQMLLARERSTPLKVIERLVAMQAQLAAPPYVGIWSRMTGFRREQLIGLVRQRKAVRGTALRGTLHLMSARDFRKLRAALQPALTHGALAMLRGRLKSFDPARLLGPARSFFAVPRTFEDLRDDLVRKQPKADVRALAYMVRMHLPLVMVPTESEWGYVTVSPFQTAESWLGQPIDPAQATEDLVLRFMAAFGPASAADLQTWSGLPGPLAREALAGARPKLVALTAERGRELFDLPRAPRPGEDAVAPVRFLPEFDNLVLSHADRRRFVADAHRRAVYLPGLRVAPTFLVDGFVAGTWKVERKKDAATLAIQPFAKVSKPIAEALVKEGRDLAAFLEPDAAKLDARIQK